MLLVPALCLYSTEWVAVALSAESELSWNQWELEGEACAEAEEWEVSAAVVEWEACA